jgi:hypothetical protein
LLLDVESFFLGHRNVEAAIVVPLDWDAGALAQFFQVIGKQRAGLKAKAGETIVLVGVQQRRQHSGRSGGSFLADLSTFHEDGGRTRF